MPFPAVKPYDERVVDLAQSQEWDRPLNAVATKIYGEGKLYVALTRCKRLSNLKITGIEPGYTGLREKLLSSWRALYWLHENGQKLPSQQVRYVRYKKHDYDNAFSPAGAGTSTMHASAGAGAP